MDGDSKKRWITCMKAAALCALVIAGACRYTSKYVSVSGNRNGNEIPVCSVETDKKEVALTFDATWGNKDMQEILDILRKHNIRSTFFLTGDWVEKYPADVKEIWREGHDLGNHSEQHKNMTQFSEKEKTQELLKVHEKVKALTGVEMKLFRPPYGAYDNKVILNAKENGYYTINWDVDSQDWKDYGKDRIISSVLEHPELKKGSIILLHSGAKYTAEALEPLICGLREKGYRIVPVSQMIYKEHYHTDVDGRQVKDK